MSDTVAKRVEFLDTLERKEAELLSWGVVDGGFTETELTDLAREWLFENGSGQSADELVRTLSDLRVLFDIHTPRGRAFRTRSAETLRLLFRLRQLLPWNDWRTAPTLVSDYRYSVVPRTYPARVLSPESFFGELDTADLLSPARKRALLDLLFKFDRSEFRYSQFQCDGTRKIFENLNRKTSSGVIVSAGTGTGKSLAFYAPALAYLAEQVVKAEHGVQILAIYPRKELLKDQFTQTFQEARRLDGYLDESGRRHIRLGTFYGDTPSAPFQNAVERTWKQSGTDYICPFLLCTQHACTGQLVWKAADLKARREILTCTECGSKTVEADLGLSRRGLAAEPPDILFTTTEMINQRLSDWEFGHLLGIGVRKAPRLVLLDEVHTYSGVHGAQVAYLLRRWHEVSGSRAVQFVGLSATLRNPSAFFSSLTGIPENQVSVVAPSVPDLTQAGMEYRLALRGDPVSATALLSTTIQTLMLLRRMLDPASRGDRASASEGLYGERVFAFTDDLDVTNRLFHNLLDAEGLSSDGLPNPNREPLASLRALSRPEHAERMQAGQSWYVAEQVVSSPGALAIPLNIGRTSSQDTGVEEDSDVVVATASLEVGYDDASVGAVVQHKAPRDSAAFLQRKGRAGRPRRMRPWTIVVLSDYGRDRMAFQSYDRLFDPELDAAGLPLSNRYVLRIQTVLATMDWLARSLADKTDGRGSVWRDLAGPLPTLAVNSWEIAAYERRQLLVRKITDILSGKGGPRNQLEKHLRRSLGLDDDSLQAVLWEPPRALLTTALPSALRRLQTNWRRITSGSHQTGTELSQPNHPLPEFVPQNLFGDLNLPEVKIEAPEGYRNEFRTHTMPALQALRAFAPGRVSRRFGIGHALDTHWVAPGSLDLAEESLSISEVCSAVDPVATVRLPSRSSEEDQAEYQVFRPVCYQLSKIPRDVSPTSNSVLSWKTWIHPLDEGTAVDLPSRSVWSDLIHDFRFYMQNQSAYVEYYRLAVGAEATVRTKSGSEVRKQLRFHADAPTRSAALGFVLDVDALCVRVEVPTDLVSSTGDLDSELERALRTSRFAHLVHSDGTLSQLNVFERDWLIQIYLSGLSAWAVAEVSDVRETIDSYNKASFKRVGQRVLDAIFQTLDTGESDEGDPSASRSKSQKVYSTLLSLCEDPDIVAALHFAAEVLWRDPTDEWEPWLQDRFLTTAGSALLEACFRMVPEFGNQDLLLDLRHSQNPANNDSAPRVREVWISESTIGGGGIIEELFSQINRNTGRFLRLVGSALQASGLELADAELGRVLSLAVSDSSVSSALEGTRTSFGHAEQVAAQRLLRNTLAERGILLTHEVWTGIQSRVLKPGSSAQTDALLHLLVESWREQEERLGIEIDNRVFAFLASEADTAFTTLLEKLPFAKSGDRLWRYQTLLSLLWPRGHAIRSQSLRPYSPFAEFLPAERQLVLTQILGDAHRVSVQNDDWQKRAVQLLSERGQVELVSRLDALESLRSAISVLADTPVDRGFLRDYPYLTTVRRDSEYVAAALQLETLSSLSNPLEA